MAGKVKVRIAVSVDPDGNWSALAYSGASEGDLHGMTVDNLEHGEARYWVTAELPIPNDGYETVEGAVEAVAAPQA